MLNIGICDDEEKVRLYIRKLIEKQDKSCKVTEFTSGGELLRYAEEERPMDILFLDIEMEEMDGMTVARELRRRMERRREAVWGSLPLLIFVTDYPEYMPEAFSVNAFQYIVKPVEEAEFDRIFAQAAREWRRVSEKRAAGPKEILLRVGSGIRNVPTAEIYYIESSSRKVIVSLPQEKIECYGKIGELEYMLGHSFFRIHRGYLVNMKYVERYSRTQVCMKNGDGLLISKYKYQDFVKAYMEYVSEEG